MYADEMYQQQNFEMEQCTIPSSQLNNPPESMKAIYPTQMTLLLTDLYSFWYSLPKFIPWYSLPKYHSRDFTGISCLVSQLVSLPGEFYFQKPRKFYLVLHALFSRMQGRFNWCKKPTALLSQLSFLLSSAAGTTTVFK